MLALVAAIAALVVLIGGVFRSARACARRDRSRAARLRRLARRHRRAVSGQQLSAPRRRIRLAAAAYRPAPDATVDRLHSGDCGHRTRPRAGAACSHRNAGSPAMIAAASSATRRRFHNRSRCSTALSLVAGRGFRGLVQRARHHVCAARHRLHLGLDRWLTALGPCRCVARAPDRDRLAVAWLGECRRRPGLW